MTVVLKSENIGNYYICLEAFVNYQGCNVYKVSLGEDLGSYYTARKETTTGNEKKAKNTFNYYRRIARNEQ